MTTVSDLIKKIDEGKEVAKLKGEIAELERKLGLECLRARKRELERQIQQTRRDSRFVWNRSGSSRFDFFGF